MHVEWLLQGVADMWDQGGQPWQQWPLNQQQWMESFQHQQDPSQIDWAALAQAWIAQREATGQVVEPQGMIPNGQDLPPPVPQMEPVPNNHNFPNDPNFNRMWQPEWGGMHHQPPPHHPPPEQPWIPPVPGPMDIVPPSEDSNSQDSGDFSNDNRHMFNQNNHNFGGPPENFPMGPGNQFDYQHGSSGYGPPQGGFHPPYWQQGPPGPPGPPAPPPNRRERPSFRERQRSPVPIPPKQEPLQIDAVKRRTLPAWIREGLEKMEREKQKKLERERMEQQRAQMKQEQKSQDAEEGDGPRLPLKSKFDSDDEEEEDDENEEDRVSPKVSRSPSPAPQEENSESELTEEERAYQMMLLTKMLLTEILLDVTNEEIYNIAKETHRKATKGSHFVYNAWHFMYNRLVLEEVMLPVKPLFHLGTFHVTRSWTDLHVFPKLAFSSFSTLHLHKLVQTLYITNFRLLTILYDEAFNYLATFLTLFLRIDKNPSISFYYIKVLIVSLGVLN